MKLSRQLIMCIIAICSGGTYWAQESITVDPKGGSVDQDGEMQGEPEEVDNTSAEQVGDAVLLFSPVFKSGDNWDFTEFNNDNPAIPYKYVDILDFFDGNVTAGVMMRPDGSLWEDASEIRVFGVFSTNPPHGGIFPLQAEGNMSRIIEDKNIHEHFNGQASQIHADQNHWAAKVSKQIDARIQLEVSPTVLLRSDDQKLANIKVRVLDDSGQIIENIPLEINAFKDDSDQVEWQSLPSPWPILSDSTVSKLDYSLPNDPPLPVTHWRIEAKHDDANPAYEPSTLDIAIVDGYWAERDPLYRGFSPVETPWLVIPLGETSNASKLELDAATYDQAPVEISVDNEQIATLTKPANGEASASSTETDFKSEAKGVTHAVAMTAPPDATEVARINISVKEVQTRTIKHIFVKFDDGQVARDGTPANIQTIHDWAAEIWYDQAAIQLVAGENQPLTEEYVLSEDPGAKPSLAEVQAAHNDYFDIPGNDPSDRDHFVFYWWDIEMSADGQGKQLGPLVWIKAGEASGLLLAHELGHNMGLWHRFENDALMRGGLLGFEDKRIYIWEADKVNP